MDFDFELLKEGLIDLKEKAENNSVYESQLGICANLDYIIYQLGYDLYVFGSAYGFVGDFSDDWEHFSGDNNYPIQDKNIYGHSNWVGESLVLRLSLIDHLINKCDDNL